MSDPNAPSPAEQLARMFHEGFRSRLFEKESWDELSPSYQRLVTEICAEIIEALLEGKIIEYPDPGNKLGMLISKTNDAKIRIDFQKPAKWFAFDEAVAIHFALTILQNCGIPVQVNIAPAVGAPESGKPV